MAPEIITQLCLIVAAVTAVVNLSLPWIVERVRVGLAAIGVNLSPQNVLTLEQLAQLAISYANEQAEKLIRSLQADGKSIVAIASEKMTGEQKMAIALQAMKSLAPPGVKVKDEQAKILIEANLQRTRSIIPPAEMQKINDSVPPPGTKYQSIAPGSLAPTDDQLKSLEAMRIEGGTK